ncbi:Gfo/Idh/MocA family oxidoreductase [Listeria seeligeri]|uniref:Dehydrogenase n=2 Tax=Listeria seeligeri TaxID=1640 RepID=A0ABR5E996_LISSE|nr:Gfo/Idh/MocA family oxidoreductase [Listeria seeligeri]EFR99364.1 Gfo/Idh/MocA family oxidoreductase [Listeria seeligeri FSL N1-067]KKD46954.1 dehydrogenase [Listeria seeligeri]MBC1577509.1 Gfo/Idh/MocA family oxidoreductase [Listeria seeligeri]MBC1595993.1 Gfo/Idh/MocA family oxidoreductase [Listeria seeligeri]MBC1598899.1 Gfo/Idh/MocA family oxidoreductase [Listeria seeligeri]
MKKYQIVIIGYGGMGSYHVTLASAADNLEVRGVFDILEEKRAAAAEKGLEIYPSFEAVLADEKVDAVLIATPNDSHKELAIQALEAGKHVVCEKPVTMSSEDLLVIMDTAKKEQKHFMVHQNRRWDEDFLIIKEMMEQKTIGDVFHLESRVHGANGIPGDWRHLKAHGGGMVLDWGVHLLDQLLFVIDSNVKSVSANLSYALGDEVDDGFVSFITFENGITAQVEVGTTNFIKLPRWYVKGTEGTAIIHDWDLSGEVVKPNALAGLSEPTPIQAGQGLTKTMAPPSEEATDTIPLVAPGKLATTFYNNFVDVLNKKSEPIVQNEEVYQVLKLIEAIFQAAETNKTIHSI